MTEGVVLAEHRVRKARDQAVKGWRRRHTLRPHIKVALQQMQDTSVAMDRQAGNTVSWVTQERRSSRVAVHRPYLGRLQRLRRRSGRTGAQQRGGAEDGQGEPCHRDSRVSSFLLACGMGEWSFANLSRGALERRRPSNPASDT